MLNSQGKSEWFSSLALGKISKRSFYVPQTNFLYVKNMYPGRLKVGRALVKLPQALAPVWLYIHNWQSNKRLPLNIHWHTRLGKGSQHYKKTRAVIIIIEKMDTPTLKPDFLRLSCAVQTYAWGKVGLESEVARLKKSEEGDDFALDEKQTYAEVRSSIVVKGL